MTRNESFQSAATRRDVLKGCAVVAATVTTAGAFIPGARAATKDVEFQLGWLASNGNMGETVAKSLGYFEEENIDLTVTPGGPNVGRRSVGRSRTGTDRTGLLKSDDHVRALCRNPGARHSSRLSASPIFILLTAAQPHPVTGGPDREDCCNPKGRPFPAARAVGETRDSRRQGQREDHRCRLLSS